MNCYLLEVWAQGQRKEQGTGWLIASDVVVTTFHVVGSILTRQWWHHAPGSDAIYQLVTGTKTIKLEPLDFDADADLAFLRVVEKSAELEVLKISTRPSQQDARWVGLAFPAFHNGKAFALSGRVSFLFAKESKRNLQLTIEQGSRVSWEGVSGCPVCVDDLVVGVITEVTHNADTGWATSVNFVEQLAKKCNIKIDTFAIPRRAIQSKPDLAALGLASAFDIVDYSSSPQLSEVLEQSRMSPSSATLVTRGALGDSVAEIARSRHFVLIDGQSGSGKTTLALGAAGLFAAEGWAVYLYIPPTRNDTRSSIEELRKAATVFDSCVIILDDINLWASSVDIERIAQLATSRLIIISTATFHAVDEAVRIELHLGANRIDLRWELLRPAVTQLLLDHEATVTDWLRKRIPEEPGRRLGYDVLSTPLAHYIERYEREAKTVWQFIFLLRGGWTESSAILKRLVSEDRSDLPVIFAAIEQIADVEQKVTPEEVLDAVGPLEEGRPPVPNVPWIESVFEKMIARRLMVSSRGAYTTVHRDWARALISVAMMPHSVSRKATQTLLERDFRLDTARPRRLMILWSWFEYDGGGAGLFLRKWVSQHREANWSMLIGTAANCGLEDLAFVSGRLHSLFRDPMWSEDLANAFVPHESVLKLLVSSAGNTDWHLLRELFTAVSYCNPSLAAGIIQDWKPEHVAELLASTDPIYYESIGWLFSSLIPHSRAWLHSVGQHLSWPCLSRQFDQVQPGGATTFLRILSLLTYLSVPLRRSMLRRIVDVLARVLSTSSLENFYFESYDSTFYWQLFPFDLGRVAQCLDVERLATELSKSNPYHWGRLLTFTFYLRPSGSTFGEELLNAIKPELFIANAKKYRDAAAHQWRLLLWQLSHGSSQTRTLIAEMMYEDILYVARRDQGERPDIARALTAISAHLGERLAHDLGALLAPKATDKIAGAQHDPEASQHFEATVQKLAALDERDEDYDIAEVTGFQVTIGNDEDFPSKQRESLEQPPEPKKNMPETVVADKSVSGNVIPPVAGPGLMTPLQPPKLNTGIMSHPHVKTIALVTGAMLIFISLYYLFIR